MGYRSDVALVLDESIYDELDAEQKNMINEVFTEPTPRECSHEGILFYVSGIKWYMNTPGFAEVDSIMKMLEDMDDEKYGFIRIGEDFDDLEVQGNPWNYEENITRSIDW
jgi:hypothetical protein